MFRVTGYVADGSVHNTARALLPKAKQEFKERAESGPAGTATVWVYKRHHVVSSTAQRTPIAFRLFKAGTHTFLWENSHEAQLSLSLKSIYNMKSQTNKNISSKGSIILVNMPWGKE